ncbi:MAG TPA: hypothetical protein VMU88_10085 [bacterium]|nr:hypothetical protein [bacterium]
MPLEPLRSDQVDALGQMSKAVYDEYKNLGFAGINVDPGRYLAFRKQGKNGLFTQFMVSDAGVFFVDPLRKIKFKFHRDYYLVYHEGLSPAEEDQLRNSPGLTVKLDNGLEFWRRVIEGHCLIFDHAHDCDYLTADQKAELTRVKQLYSPKELVIKPMLQNKTKDSQPHSNVIDLED